MNSIYLDEIIYEFENTSYYNIVSKPQKNLYKKIIVRAIIIMFLLTSIEIYILYKLGWYNIDNIMVLLALTSFIVFIPPIAWTSNKLNKKYIFEYNKKYSNRNNKPYTNFDEIRFNEFYKLMLKNYNYIFSDNIFNILISYIEAKEKQLSKDPEYSSKLLTLISILVGLLASIVGGIIPLIVQDLNTEYKLLLILIAIGAILLAYSFVSQIISFQTKKQKLKKSLKDVKVFLYNCKLRYDLENTQEISCDINNTKESSYQTYTNKKNSKTLTKTKLHKIIDILFE